MSNITSDRKLYKERAIALQSRGVHIEDIDRVDIRGDITCGLNVSIDINVIIKGNVKLGNNVVIGAHCILEDCLIQDDVIIHPYSMVQDSNIGTGSFVGPYGRVRPGTILGDNVQIGNFVEIKNSKVSSGCRINHHSFVGDSDLENNVTLGAGTITCNHNGKRINKIEIGANSYIGSGCNLIAPLYVGERSFIGAGSTISKDTESGKLTIARSRQITVDRNLLDE